MDAVAEAGRLGVPDAVISLTGAETRALISTLVFCGLRVSDTLGLRWADIDIEGNQLHVRGIR